MENDVKIIMERLMVLKPSTLDQAKSIQNALKFLDEIITPLTDDEWDLIPDNLIEYVETMDKSEMYEWMVGNLPAIKLRRWLED
jgi:hypothetical protein